MMRQFSAALQTLLYNLNAWDRWDLFVFWLPGGRMVYLTSAPQNLSVADSLGLGIGTQTFTAAVVRRTRSTLASDGSVDDAEVVISGASLTLLGNGLGVSLSALAGLFDGVKCAVINVYASTPGDSSNLILDVLGVASPADISSTNLTLRVKTPSSLLTLPYPTRLMQPACPFQLGDANCNASVSPDARTAAAGSTASSIVPSAALTNANAIGWVTFTSGNLAGMSRAIRPTPSSWPNSGITIALMTPFPAAPAVGDAFTAAPGCDKSRGPKTTTSSGCAGFGATPRGNLDNFGGFSDCPGDSFIPVQTVA